MFFWGAYSFQNSTSTGDVPGKPPLRYPMYVPPPPALLPSRSSSSFRSGSNAERKYESGENDSLLARLERNRLKVHLIACGAKHIIATVSVIQNKNANCFSSEIPISGDIKESDTFPETEREESIGGEKESDRSAEHPFLCSERLVGMGNNEAGPLGPYIPHYSSTLVPLRLEERLTHLNSPSSTPSIISGSLTAGDGSNGIRESDHPSNGQLPPLIVSLACGYRHSLFVTRQGDVYACGENGSGQLGVTQTLSNSRSGKKVGGGESTLRNNTMKTSAGVAHVTASVGGSSSNATFISDFTLVPCNVPICRAFANGNVSFALDNHGGLFSWGDPQYGQLGHGDLGERVDIQTLKTVTEPVSRPTKVEWFSSRHLQISDVAVGKQHMVCSTVDGEVYSMGTNTYGKLGLGDVQTRLLPSRVSFPSRQPERLLSFACGDDHTVVLQLNPTVGTIVYFFGKLSNGDGQLTPMVLSFPHHNISPTSPYATLLSSAIALDLSSTRLTHVFAGRGTQCAAVNADGVLWVWGKHSNLQNVTNGTPAWAGGRQIPTVVTSLLPFRVKGVAIGGCMAVAYAEEKREIIASIVAEDASEGVIHGSSSTNSKKRNDGFPASKVPKLEHDTKENDRDEKPSFPLLATKEKGPSAQSGCFFTGWDIAIPHDDRVGLATGRGGGAARGDVTEQYESGVKAFLDQYLEGMEEEEKSDGVTNGVRGRGRTLSQAYASQLPPAPSLSPLERRAVFDRVSVKQLSAGDKIRVWMTDLYALGTVQEVVLKYRTATAPSSPLVDDALPLESSSSRAPSSSLSSNDPLKGFSQGARVRVEWLRDDWQEEEISLYSDDETLASENQNRWQPFWYEKSKTEDGCNAWTTGGL